MEAVKISIIIPIFNTSEYLAKCIESVINQTLASIEIILVNDNSPDPKDSEICQHYAASDPRVKYFVNDTLDTNGPSSARNFGIQKAVGAFVTFVDSDDWLKPEMYQRMYDAALKHDADTVQCGVMRVHDNASMDQPFIVYDKTMILNDREILNSVPLPNLPHINNTQTAVWNKLYKRSLIMDNSIRFNTSMQQIEDIEFTYRVAYFSKKSVLMDDIFYQYYARKASIMDEFDNDTPKRFINAFESTKKFLIEKDSFQKEFCHKFYRQYCEYISLYIKNINNSKDRTLIIKNIINNLYSDDFLNAASLDQVESILNPYANNKYQEFSRLSTFKKIIFLLNFLKLKISQKVKKQLQR